RLRPGAGRSPGLPGVPRRRPLRRRRPRPVPRPGRRRPPAERGAPDGARPQERAALLGCWASGEHGKEAQQPVPEGGRGTGTTRKKGEAPEGRGKEENRETHRLNQKEKETSPQPPQANQKPQGCQGRIRALNGGSRRWTVSWKRPSGARSAGISAAPC